MLCVNNPLPRLRRIQHIPVSGIQLRSAVWFAFSATFDLNQLLTDSSVARRRFSL